MDIVNLQSGTIPVVVSFRRRPEKILCLLLATAWCAVLVDGRSSVHAVFLPLDIGSCSLRIGILTISVVFKSIVHPIAIACQHPSPALSISGCPTNRYLRARHVDTVRQSRAGQLIPVSVLRCRSPLIGRRVRRRNRFPSTGSNGITASSNREEGAPGQDISKGSLSLYEYSNLSNAVPRVLLPTGGSRWSWSSVASIAATTSPTAATLCRILVSMEEPSGAGRHTPRAGRSPIISSSERSMVSSASAMVRLSNVVVGSAFASNWNLAQLSLAVRPESRRL